MAQPEDVEPSINQSFEIACIKFWFSFRYLKFLWETEYSLFELGPSKGSSPPNAVSFQQ